MKSRTLIVPIGNVPDDYDREMRKSLEKFWDFTPYEIVSSSEQNRYLLSENHAVLLTYQELSGVFVSGYSLKIVLGDKKYSKAEYATKIVSFSLPHTTEPITKKEVIMNFNHLIPLIIKNMNHFLHERYDKIEKPITKANMAQYYGDAQEKMKGRTLYFDKSTIRTGFSTEDFSKNCGLPSTSYKMATKEEISEAVMNGNDKVAIIYGSYSSYKHVFDPSTGTILCSTSDMNKQKTNSIGTIAIIGSVVIGLLTIFLTQ